MRTLPFLMLALVLALLTSDARADRYADCEQDDDSDLRVRACTEIIERKKQETPEKRAEAHYRRGWAAALALNLDDILYEPGDELFDPWYENDPVSVLSAIFDFQSAFELDPDLEDEFYSNFVSRPVEEIVVAFEVALLLLPEKEADLYAARGEAYFELGDYDAAIGHLDRALELNPKLKVMPTYGDAYDRRGADRLKKGQHDLAIVDFTKAIEVKPNALNYNKRGNAYSGKGDLDRAIADYSKAIEIDPKGAVAYANRGSALERKGDRESAIADYTKAIALDPENDWALFYRGNAHRKAGAYELAIADFDKAIEIDPDDFIHGVHYHRGLAYRETGDLDRAIADFTKAIEIDPDDPAIYRDRAQAYAEQGNTEKAEADKAKAQALDPEGNVAAPAQDAQTGRKQNAPRNSGGEERRQSAQSASEDVEIAFWNSVKDSSDPAMFEAYLEKFPDGDFAPLAKINLEKLKSRP